MRKILLLLLCMLPMMAFAEDTEIYFDDVIAPQQQQQPIVVVPQTQESQEQETDPTAEAAPSTEVAQLTAREDFINRIVEYGYELYVKADGKAQSAHYKGDIYLCKNFTTHIFNTLRDDFCIAEYPNVRLRIPNNIAAEDSKPYYKGVGWETVSAKDGNPFYEAASFRYDNSLTYEENLELAMEFMRQAQRGDFFQMNADYEYGTGPHSAIILGYDAEKDEIHWMDSNMRGHTKTVNGERVRYGICQFDEVKSVEWWAQAFCHKKRGATLYRLRDDIAYRD